MFNIYLHSFLCSLVCFTVLAKKNCSFVNKINYSIYIPVNSTCRHYFENFAFAVSNFTECSILHSHPFSICRSCSNEFNSFEFSYEFLKNFTDKDNITCLEKDSKENGKPIIGKNYDFIKNIWEENYCQKCYKEKDRLVYSDHMVLFMNKLDMFDNCIFNEIENHLPYIIPGKLKVNKTICTTCLRTYKNLSDFYSQLDPNFDGQFCMDLSELMNFTWNLWHEQLKCTSNIKKVDACIGTSLALLFLPILFYFISKICSSDMKKIFIRGIWFYLIMLKFNVINNLITINTLGFFLVAKLFKLIEEIKAIHWRLKTNFFVNLGW